MSTTVDNPAVDAAEIRSAMEYYQAKGWSDGLPVVPVTESYLQEFLATTSREPDEVLFVMPHLNRKLTVRLAAINADYDAGLIDGQRYAAATERVRSEQRIIERRLAASSSPSSATPTVSCRITDPRRLMTWCRWSMR